MSCRISPKSDNKCEKCRWKYLYVHKYGFQKPIFMELIITPIIRVSPIPNFTQICRKIYKIGQTLCASLSMALPLCYDASARIRVMGSPVVFLQFCLFCAAVFQFRIWSKETASFSTFSSHLPRDLATDLLLPKLPLKIFGLQ
jgi:hypothetical protein